LAVLIVIPAVFVMSQMLSNAGAAMSVEGFLGAVSAFGARIANALRRR
jgi:hypothetical protein